MIFVETPVFTRQIRSLISEDSYSQMQQWLLDTPARGDVIRGSGGCRKLRWKLSGKGKRGGIRVIYYWQKRTGQLFMLLACGKNELLI